MSIEQPASPTFSSRLGKAFTKLLRFVLVLIIGAAIGAGVYFGVPYLYQRFILPVETNTARLAEVEARQTGEVDGFSTQFSDIKSRLSDLESRQTENSQSLTDLQGKIKAVENAISANDAALKKLDNMQTNLNKLSSDSSLYESLLVGKNSALADLQFQIDLSRSIELLSRARLYLSQSNYGLARQDVQAALDQLTGMIETAPENEIPIITSAISRLTLALGNLPSYPVVAVDDLDIAWQILVTNAPQEPQPTEITATVTPTPQPAIQPTSTQ